MEVQKNKQEVFSMKTMKKLASLAMAAAMTAAALPSFAAVAEVNVTPGEIQAAGTATAEQAIAVAKTMFDIPAELTECDFGINDSRGEQEFDITWSDKERTRTVEVEVNSRLVPTGYWDSANNSSRGLSRIRKAEMLKTAEEFLGRTVPRLADSLVYDEEESGGIRFVFNRYENGIRVEDNYASINVNRYSGQVMSYSLSWDFDSDFTSFGESVGPDQAYSVLNDKAVRTEYRIFGDKAFPVIVYDSSVYVDPMGETFTPISLYSYGKLMNGKAAPENMAFDSDEASAQASGGGDGGYRLTQEEMTAVEKMSSLISREKVEEIIAGLPELSLPENYALKLTYITYRYEDGEEEKTQYNVICDFETVNDDGYAELTLNAETGEVMSFYSWSDKDYRSSDEAPAYDADKTRSIGEEFIKKIKDVTDYRPGESYGGDGARLVRYIGDIPYPADNKWADVSSNTGKVTRFYENVPTAEIVTPASMIDRLTAVKNAYAAGEIYTYKANLDGEGNYVGGSVTKARKLVPNTDFYVLKAEDGTPLGYDGEKVTVQTEKNDETSHPAWNAFDILRENDITLTGSFSFDDQITRGDFDTLISMLGGIEVIPYRYYYDGGIMFDEETLNAPVTREDAVSMVAERLNWDPLVSLDIYNVSFTDRADFTGGIGGAAILQGLGIIGAESDGRFRPKDMLTYGEAFILAYNIADKDIFAKG